MAKFMNFSLNYAVYWALFTYSKGFSCALSMCSISLCLALEPESCILNWQYMGGYRGLFIKGGVENAIVNT